MSIFHRFIGKTEVTEIYSENDIIKQRVMSREEYDKELSKCKKECNKCQEQ